MPEHVHLLLLPTQREYNISAILTAIKQPVTRKAVKFLREHDETSLAWLRDEQPNGKVSHRFWQRGGGYDRNLVDPKIIYATIDYIHADPVRRGLVASPDDWYWSSCRHFFGHSNVPLAPDVDSMPPRED